MMASAIAEPSGYSKARPPRARRSRTVAGRRPWPAPPRQLTVRRARGAWRATTRNVSLTTGLGHGGDAEGDLLSNVENLSGSTWNDTLEGNAGNNSLWGNDQYDTLYGRAGSDKLYGGNGDDVLQGGSGADLLEQVAKSKLP